MEITEVAAQARDFLSSPSRWRKGGSRANGRKCMGNAILFAKMGNQSSSTGWWPIRRELRAAAKIIREQFPERVRSLDELHPCYDRDAAYVYTFNDHDDTTCADVQLVLEKMRAG